MADNILVMKNGKKIDAIRQKIQEWFDKKAINENEYFFLLASLLESADKVANTASVYGAFLKHLKKSALKELKLKPALFEINDNSHQVFKEDANTLIKKIQGDILYLDPPYNRRHYGAYYHIFNTISVYENFTPKGKSGFGKYYKSNYCSSKKVLKSFDKLINDANFKYIFLSYNNEGLMSEDDVKEVMSKYGRYDLAIKKYQRFKADKTTSRNHKADKTFEYLHILIKDEK